MEIREYARKILQSKKSRESRLILFSVIIGFLGAFSAQLFLWMIGISSDFFLGTIAGYTPPLPASEGGTLVEHISSHGYYFLPIATTLGGLLSGLLVFGLAPEAVGHGTDAAIRAFHRLGGSIRARVPVVKGIASAITIGSGGAAGREGPTAQIAAGISSILATALRLPIEERRVLMLAGMAAGISAIFKTPLGAAILVVEVLYSSTDFEVEALMYTIIAASVAYAVNGFFSGWTPIFEISPGLHFQNA
ncbi:MAG: chloride channel protein, partial [Bdellovibrionales bacterium]|nr:chloride channel protein [Bdellovibrionales bacterium]